MSDVTIRRLQLGLLLAALAAATAGCHDREDADRPTASAEQALANQSVDEQAPGIAPSGEDDDRGPRIAEPTLGDVDDEAVAKASTIDTNRLDDEFVDRLDDIDLPVLLPDDDALLEAGDLYGIDHTYTFTIHVDDDGQRDHTITIRGSRMKPEFPDDTDGIDDTDEYRITETHLIQSLAFDRFDVSYTVDLECNRPHENETCRGHDYIMSVADSMKLVETRDQ